MTITENTRTCTKCGKPKEKKQFYYHRQRKHYTATCKQCNAKKQVEYAKAKQTDLNFITMSRAAEIRYRCKKNHHNREVASNLRDILRQQWKNQNGLCYYSGLPMVLSNEYHTNPDVMTVDRVDSSNGYVEGNVVLCCSIVNRMKQNLSLESLKELCAKILQYNPSVYLTNAIPIQPAANAEKNIAIPTPPASEEMPARCM